MLYTKLAILSTVTALVSAENSRLSSASFTAKPAFSKRLADPQDMSILPYPAPTPTSSAGIPSKPGDSGDGSWFRPTVGISMLCSLNQAVPLNTPVSESGLQLEGDVYDVDLFNTPTETIQAYHDQGKKVICYFVAGTWDPERPDKGNYDPSCYCDATDKCKQDGWDQWYLDIHFPECIDNVQTVIGQRIALAKEKHCDAIEPDNVDVYDNDSGWAITIEDQLNFLLWMSTTAHAAGLGMGLKNSPKMIREKPEIVQQTDFVLIEKCSLYDECAAYQPFIDAGKATWAVEYDLQIPCDVPGMQMTEYTTLQVDFKNIVAVCNTPKGK